MIPFSIHPETGHPVVEGRRAVPLPNLEGDNQNKIFATTKHFVKEVPDEVSARSEVSAGRFMRKLGVHEVPDHHYGTDGKRHFVITDHVVGGKSLLPGDEGVTHDPKRLNDMVAAERYIRAGDRHAGNYLVRRGTVHPIDFGYSFQMNPSRNPTYNALRQHQAAAGHDMDAPVSPEMHETMKTHLPLLKLYLTHHHGTMGLGRYNRIHDAVMRGLPPTIMDLT